MLAQFGQTEGLLKIHMAYISRSDLGQQSTSESAIEKRRNGVQLRPKQAILAGLAALQSLGWLDPIKRVEKPHGTPCGVVQVALCEHKK